jgi:DNA gyrase subunit A
VLARLGDDYARSADIVDSAAEYEALVGLVQPFRRRYPLAEGRGNFGSIDDDPPADPPYTEARLAPLARELPAFPNLLVNGSRTVPPHNLREVAAAVLDGADLPGPDFPTGGEIVSGLRELYETGTGAITVRARSHVEGRTIVVTELPYGVPKGGDDGIFMQVAELGLREVRDIEDLSARGLMRIEIVVAREADPQAVLATLLARTTLETTIAADLTAPLRELIEELAATCDPGRLRDVADRFGDDRRTSTEPRPPG